MWAVMDSAFQILLNPILLLAIRAQGVLNFCVRGTTPWGGSTRVWRWEYMKGRRTIRTAMDSAFQTLPTSIFHLANRTKTTITETQTVTLTTTLCEAPAQLLQNLDSNLYTEGT